MHRFILGLVITGVLAGCDPGDPRFDVKDDETLRCLKARGLTSDWELSRGYTAAKGLAPSYVPNSVTSVQLSYASAHCNVDPKERARLLELLRSSGYADPT